jgi:membrane protein involved in D-alanine export
MIHSSICFFLCQLLLKNFRPKIIAPLSLLVAFIPLIFYKYSVPQSIILDIIPLSKSLLRPAVFLGISFYTFRVSSIMIDILYKRIKDQINFFQFYNFSLFFPCLLSGPLDRYSRFIADIENGSKLSWQELYNAIARIAWGIFKKIVIADILWNFSNDSYHSLELYQLPIWKVIIGQYGYYLMLYFDFSGYTDIAIGISHLFGIKTPENFNRPWKARNIQIFWNSWHISFMNWLRDYIFFPLQALLLRIGVTNIPLNNSLSYFSVFIVAGIWHGEQLNFLYYGIFHGVGFMLFFLYKQVLERFLNKEQRRSYLKNRHIELISIFITFHFFLVSLFFFINKQEFLVILFKKAAHYAR